jgi:hypothetical protein
VEDIQPVIVPQVAECPRTGQRGVAQRVVAARIAHLGPVGESLRKAEGLKVANYGFGVDEVVAHRRVRKHVTLRGFNHVGRRRNEAAGLAFQVQLLRVDAAGCQQCKKEKAAD